MSCEVFSQWCATVAFRQQLVPYKSRGEGLRRYTSAPGVRLLQKTPSGYVLPPVGERALGSGERMEAEAFTMERSITGEYARRRRIPVSTVTCVMAVLSAPYCTTYRTP